MEATTHKPRLAEMTAADILAKYGLTNPFADVLAFTREAEKLRAALKMKTVQVGFTGCLLATYTRTVFSVTGYDQWGSLIAVSRDNAADCLADVARENAKRWGKQQKNAPVAEAGLDMQPANAHGPQYARSEQKEKIIRLLNHPKITRPEKTKMLLNINRLDEERASQAIAKLRKAIDERENGEASIA